MVTESGLLAAVDAAFERTGRLDPMAGAARDRDLTDRTHRAVAAGALPLVVARSRLGDGDDAGVTLGVGDPAVCVTWFPVCGCDAWLRMAQTAQG